MFRAKMFGSNSGPQVLSGLASGVTHEAIKSIPTKTIEPFDATLKRRREEMVAMAEEAPEHLIFTSTVADRFQEFVRSAPLRTAVAGNATCAGVGLWLTTKVLYALSPYVGASLPATGLPIYRFEGDRAEEVLRLDRYGRAGGLFGWDKYRDVVGWTLGSFLHNFIAMLAGYIERPKIPFRGEWVLPNLVLAETVTPRQAIVPASFNFTFLRPSVRPTFIFEYSSETPVTFGFEFWDSMRNDVARIDSYSISETGDVRVRVSAPKMWLTRSGYFTIDIHDAPYGIVLRDISTIPVSI